VQQNLLNGEANMNTKIEGGEQATAAVQEYVRQALEALQSDDGRVNATGVMLQPIHYRAALLAAAGQLNAAAVLIERTRWPTGQDYDAAGM
jgi:hypothetical protein